MIRRQSVIAIGVALLVVCAGCSGGQQTPAPETTASPTSTATPSPTPTPEPTETATPNPKAENPWESEEVVVRVYNAGNSSRSFVPLVENATEWWSDRATEYTEYDVEFVVDQTAIDPDVAIRVTGTLGRCGEETDTDDFLGCAPIYEGVGDAVGYDTDVWILAGQTNATTVRTVKHELGHTLGLRHDAADDLPLMSAIDENATSLPVTNASDREFPFGKETIRVYVEYGEFAEHKQEPAREQVEHALRWFEAGADGHLNESHEFVRVDDPERADIRIRLQKYVGCRNDRVCAYYRYANPDSDPAPEEYTSLNVTISMIDTDPDSVAWLVGWPMSKVLIDRRATHRPMPFQDNIIDQGRWWED